MGRNRAEGESSPVGCEVGVWYVDQRHCVQLHFQDRATVTFTAAEARRVAAQLISAAGMIEAAHADRLSAEALARQRADGAKQ